jgi:murein DD-endopeptidase MepM/ murein hydrolase activator NlpD
MTSPSPIGRHRAQRRQSGARRMVKRASFAGATLALPVIGATATSAFAGDSDTYTVEAGDTLSSIAADQDIDGGYQALYDANKDVIGDDPNLIRPGEKLSLDVGSSSSSGSSTSASDASYGTDTSTTQATATLPVSDAQPTAGYDAQGSEWTGSRHTGQDWSVPTGTTVKAAIGGTVVEADWNDSFGYQIVIKHASGSYQHYAHLSQIDVKTGESVGKGDAIAKSGATGNATGPHLHFEVRKTVDYGSDVNPITWLADHGVTANH